MMQFSPVTGKKLRRPDDFSVTYVLMPEAALPLCARTRTTRAGSAGFQSVDGITSSFPDDVARSQRRSDELSGSPYGQS